MHLDKATGFIREQPYRVICWNNRAEILLELGYPELALGDCYKALRLILDSTKDQRMLDLLGELCNSLPAWQPFKEPQSEWRKANTSLDDITQLVEHLAGGHLMTNNPNACLDACHVGLNLNPKSEYFTHCLGLVQPAWVERNLASLSKFVREISQSRFDPLEAKEQLRCGSIDVQPYPWGYQEWEPLGRCWLHHTPGSVVSDLQQRITTSSGGKCFLMVGVRDSSVFRNARDYPSQGSVPKVVEPAVGGLWESSRHPPSVTKIHASRSLTRGETLLRDHSFVGSSTSASSQLCNCCSSDVSKNSRLLFLSPPCCNTNFCSHFCMNTALEAYHPVLCGKDLSFLRPDENPALAESVSDNSLARLVVFTRTLAVILRELEGEPSHPLQTDIMYGLRAPYPETQHDKPARIAFDFQNNIVYPLDILHALGVDIFADARFDTWVLHTILVRLNNNQHSNIHSRNAETFGGRRGKSKQFMALSPLYALFNHSCDPNVAYRHVNGSTAIDIFVIKDVRDSEELCVSYLEGIDNMDYEERQERLQPWMGGAGCQCKRCSADRKLGAEHDLAVEKD